MASKADLQQDQELYHKLVRQAHAAQGKGLIRAAISAAKSAWPHIEGMMRFERRYEGRVFDSVEAIDLVLEFAPLLMDSQSLDELNTFLNEHRSVDRHAKADLAQALQAAHERMWCAHRLWHYLDEHSGSTERDIHRALGGDQETWREIMGVWHAMGLLNKTNGTLALRTRLGELVGAKCPACGAVTHAPKAMLLDELACPDCATRVCFVILEAAEPIDREGA